MAVTPDEDEVSLALLLLQQYPVSFEQEEEEEEESVSEDELEVKISNQTYANKGKKRKVAEVDNSKETLLRMINWEANRPKNPPRRIFVRDPDAMGACSELMWKQLTGSDVKENQCRLHGQTVSVYGPKGEIHEMVFKMWKKDTPVLMSVGWKNFVKKYKLEKHVDFLTIWMFRHKETRKICFAIDSTRFPVKGMLSPKILNAAFRNP
ncbi:DNA-binding pseudobarrel domain superfamily [Arabidopsis thaliana x Arabidopsis arenosa]|uniref:DNA-binding pseudobarrel domain superfamily n=1 Tax=Arabidopsis thaliana x Arabidopsis arenosa TaxID=1240361 RepID=A0A8T2BHA8_9BRAS|nr:DNA-binding pseudobarrel domain superfamily [Arabidopsis thaliana x Arabidopsis arenosa]